MILKKHFIKSMAVLFSTATLFTVAAPQTFYAVKPGESNEISAQQQYLNDWLLACAENGNLEELNSLLAQGADVDARNDFGYTALMWAAKNGHIDIVNALLAHGADVNAKEPHEYTALHICAAKRGYTDIVNALLKHGADVNAKKEYGSTALMTAAYCGNIDIVNTLLAHGADVNAKDERGWTALIYAARFGNIDIVNALFARGADVNAKNEHGDTALMITARFGNIDIVNALLNIKGIDLNIRDNEYRTAFLRAILSHQYQIADALKNAGADFNNDEQDGAALLFEGARTGNRDFIDLAFWCLPRPEVRKFKNRDGQNALMVAAKNGHTKIGSLLLSYFDPIDINEQDNFGKTALMYAVDNNHPEFAKLLINRSYPSGSWIDIEALKIKDNRGNDVDAYARRMGYRDFFDWLNKAKDRTAE